ncbi:DUF2777 domain-containing protein [Salipaludibacillus sp. CUR1]|uniref:DUF2777 family protein n=1 Tax=Salipaludibacillus sp. CUR1 TaxID=2820003 RepID=UPI001E3EFECE|nr:DUF2777 family protein [Salipaludibacillus sp. CUR1]MCE7792114.1 DUF2777 domain-containing protein [Salipaludibacillus sp. CUR1]
MDRKTAKEYTGHQVLLDEGEEGTYVGVLLEVLTEPKTPWSGKVQITGVLSCPSINLNNGQGIHLLYSADEVTEVAGRKISLLKTAFNKSFNESFADALKTKWDSLRDMSDKNDKYLSIIQQELRKINSEHVIYEEAFVYYQLVKKGRNLYIYDEQKRESLSLEDCPFEFEVEVNGEWKTAFYKKGFTFETLQQENVELQHGSTVRLNRAQFDPYRILLNELDDPSLIALEKGLEKLGIGHEHSVYCHNSLLIKLLSSFNETSFSGVNFLSYANETNQFAVQHHYERTMLENEPDITFDRFEFTSDDGQRVLTSYATHVSKD